MQHRALAILLFGASAVAACGGEQQPLNGAGATFPYPIYSKWFSDYAAATGVRINYQSIGSGGGIQQLLAGTVDFGASDGPMTDEEMSRARGGAVLHFPSVLGADVVGYNLPDVTAPLRLTGEVIAGIFLGEITKWNDPRIASLNAGAALPGSDIIVVHRSDGSGTTYIFTDYLSTISPKWAAGPGRGKEVKWPTGLGAKGNEGVSGQVKQTVGSIGYMELAYAKQNNIPVAWVQDAAGEFVEPTIESISAAAAGAIASLPPDTDYRVSIVNAPGTNAYPISSFTWLLVSEQQADAEKGRKLVDFLRWMYGTGQASAASLHYAPLPPVLVERLTERLSRIKLGAAP
jgi:phosphate transport system substrate-binding protein